MSYIDRYSSYLAQLPEDIRTQTENGRRHYMAFTSNYDVVLKWDSEAFSRLLEEYLADEPAAKAGDRIDTMEDLARISAYCAMNGLGMNFDITDVKICDRLLDSFEKESALGGTGAQGAGALSTAGFPVTVQLTDRCREVCEMLNQSDMRVVRGKELIPVMEGASDEEPVYHIILQFTKGDVIRVHGREVKIPLSNRLIFFYDHIHKIVPVGQDYLEYLPEHAEEISSLVVSGFDAIVDIDIARERAEQITGMLSKLKSRAPGLPVYMEGAFYMNPEVKELFFKSIGQYASVIGTNEEELADLSGRHGKRADITDLSDVLGALDRMICRYGCGGVILHTKDYSMFYGTCPEGVDIEKGLTIGNLMSGTRARTGRYGTRQDLAESLELPLSQEGLRFYEQLSELKTERYAILVPSRYMEHPLYTIGLGDTFVAGVQTAFV